MSDTNPSAFVPGHGNDLKIGEVDRILLELREERDHIGVDSGHLRLAIAQLGRRQLPSHAGSVTDITVDLGFNAGLCEVVATEPGDYVFWSPRMLRQGVPKTTPSGAPWRTRWVVGKVKPPTKLVTMIVLWPPRARGVNVIIAAWYGPKTAREYDDPRATADDKAFWKSNAYVSPIDPRQLLTGSV